MSPNNYRTDNTVAPGGEAFRNATFQQKSAAFEWVRGQALKEGNPDWFHAGVLLAEVSQLRTTVEKIEQACFDEGDFKRPRWTCIQTIMALALTKSTCNQPRHFAARSWLQQIVGQIFQPLQRERSDDRKSEVRC